MLADSSWAVGQKWTMMGGSGDIAYETTGTETYAGIEGRGWEKSGVNHVLLWDGQKS